MATVPAARFLYLQRTAYGGKVQGQNFGVVTERPARFDLVQVGPLLEEIYERLSSVTIENLDWLDFIDRYDRPGTLFYLDPPYWGNEDDYLPGAFGREQFGRIAERLRSLQGRAIVSLNDVAGVRQAFAGFRLEETELPHTIGQASGGVKEAREVLIYTFEAPVLPLFG